MEQKTRSRNRHICGSSIYYKSDISDQWGNGRQFIKGFQQLIIGGNKVPSFPHTM